nr:hypothetical protein [Halovivax limisalsi]
MRSVERSSGGAGESARNRECYRCGRTVASSCCFTIEIEPPAGLSSKYADSVRYCCEDCAAGMNLSDFSRRWKASARRGDRSSAD